MKMAFALLALFSAAAFAQEKGSFVDARDKKTYKTVKIGKQTWLAENLSFNAKGSKCYDNKDANCKKYGRLYDWATALKACHKGWHLPKSEEWDVLYRYADGTSGTESPYESETAGKYLKATSGWNRYTPCNEYDDNSECLSFGAERSGNELGHLRFCGFARRLRLRPLG